MTYAAWGSAGNEAQYVGPPPMVPAGARVLAQPPPWWPPPPAPWPVAPLPPPPPAVRWAPPPGTPPHDVPQPYLLAMRARDWGWWRPLLGLLLLGIVYLVAATAVVFVTLATGIGTDLAQLDLADPLTLLVTNLSLIVAIPVVWLAWVTAHGMRPRLVVLRPGPAALAARAALHADGRGHPGRRHRGLGAGLVPARRGAGHRAGALVRLAAGGRRPHHAAAVGRGGVPLPRLPEPGDRRLGASSRRRRGDGRASSPPPCSPRRTCPGTSRPSWTDSPSGWRRRRWCG